MDQLLARFLSPAKIRVMREFLCFGAVGLVGFCFDTATVYASKALFGLYVAGLFGYIVAATVTWWLNRIWTFRGNDVPGSILRQWASFMSANAVGFLCNRGVYALLITFSALCVRYPIIAVAAGVPAGMVFNFHLSRRFVFRTHIRPSQPGKG